MTGPADVLVVGAGFAGCSAARVLAEQGLEHFLDVLVHVGAGDFELRRLAHGAPFRMVLRGRYA